ncbi:hypothetical protein HAX54_051412 [Datura stramonium]|uniref:Uncharacterized protein n=1 Tax=Datura stramonium TaxID=4076 RepID=A0ABS8WMF2_DATST|nr:hypothetical protein [Datura stramonium]
MPRLEQACPKSHLTNRAKEARNFHFQLLITVFFLEERVQFNNSIAQNLKFNPVTSTLAIHTITHFCQSNNDGSGLQQQHEPLLGILGSQGLRHPFIGNTNYRSMRRLGIIMLKVDLADLNGSWNNISENLEIVFGTNIENTAN